jgi:hypothetical protein
MGKKVAPIVGAVLVLALAQRATAGQIGYWAFDDGTGAIARDSSGNGNNGTLTGGPAWTVGQFGKALQFDGVDDYVNIPHNDNLIPTTGKVTVSVWINAKRHTGPNGGQWQGILAKGGSPRLYNLYTEASQVIHFSTTGPSGSFIGPLSTGQVPLNEWVHVAVVVDGRDYFYINGQPAGVGGEGSVIQTGGTAPLTIGKTDEANFFQGMIDEVRLYDVPLTAAQIQDLFTSNTSPTWPKAAKPSPPDGAIGITLAQLAWTKGDGASRHSIYLGRNPELTEADLLRANWTKTSYIYPDELVPGATYYWRVDEFDSKGNLTATGDVWKFTAEPLTGYDPKPADGSTGVFPILTLKWTMSSMALGQHLYFSSVPSEVADAAPAADKGPAETSDFTPGVLRSSTTYYWRVDETQIDPNTFEEVAVPGPIWSFTTADAVPNKIVRQWWTSIGSGTAVTDLTGNTRYPDNPTDTAWVDTFEAPTDWADNYGTRMYGWLVPPQTGDYTFWIASDDSGQLLLSTDIDPANATPVASVSGWTISQEWTKYPSQKSATIPLQAGQKYYLEALQKEGGGGDNLAVSWQGPSIAGPTIIDAQYVDAFALPPVQAYMPSPAHKAVDVPYTGSLSWAAGEGAEKHNVYFGTDANAVVAADTGSPLYQGQQTGTSFEAGTLEWGKTYYWRVDEIGATGTLTGNVWSFTTRNFLLVDDLESYTTENAIFDTWLDNYDSTLAWDQQKGVTVGWELSPYVETRAAYVHGGKQSMPLHYDNTGPKYLFSQTVREVDEGNWTGNGLTDLSLWVRGYPDVNTVTVTETAGKMSLTGGGSDIWNASDQFTFAYKTLNGDGTMQAKVVSIGTGTNTWAKGGVMIRDSLDGQSASAQMFLTANSDGTAGNGAAFQNRATAGLNMQDNDATSNTASAMVIAPPYWVKIERKGDTMTGYLSPDGVTWSLLGSTTVVMSAPVYVGMFVTSHNANEQRTFNFESISATGGVSGNWQGAVIVSRFANTPTGLYVTLEDTTGKKSATQFNATAVNSATYTQVKFPLSGFTGVSLSKIRSVYLSVGDPKTTVAGGTGQIYIDDVRVVQP